MWINLEQTPAPTSDDRVVSTASAYARGSSISKVWLSTIETLVHAAFRWSPAATPADLCAPLVTESCGRSGLVVGGVRLSVGPLSRSVSGFAWAVSSAFLTISLCRAQVEWQRSCGGQMARAHAQLPP